MSDQVTDDFREETHAAQVAEIMAHLEHEGVTLRELVTFLVVEQPDVNDLFNEIHWWLEGRSMEGQSLVGEHEINETLAPRDDTLELTEEMSLPPDFDLEDPVAVWDAENQRDLVAEVRGELRNARGNGYDALGSSWDINDLEVARELQNLTTGYEHVPIDALEEAVRLVRESQYL